MALDLGTIYSSIEIRTAKLEQNAKQSTAIFDKMAGDIGKISETLSTKLERDIAQSAEKATKAAEIASRKAADAIKRHWQEVGQSFESAGKQLTIGLTLPIVAFGAAAFKQSLEMDTLKRSLTAVTGSTKEMNRQMERAKEIAKLPGLGFKESVEGLVKLQAGGFKFEEASRTLMAFGNALATVGKGKNELSAVNEQLSQMVGKGKVMQEDVRIIQQYVPQLRQAMKAAFGTSNTEEIQKMGIPIQDFLAKINKELEKLPKMTGGVKNAMENFSDSSQRALAAVGDAILPIAAKFLDNVVPAIEKAGAAFNHLPDAAKAAILGNAGLVATAGVATLAIGKIITIVQALRTSLATPIVIRIAGIALAAEGLIYLAKLRMDALGTQEDKEAAARRSIASADTGMMDRVAGFKQFPIKSYYSDSLKKTLGNINAEQRDPSITSGFPGSRRDKLTRDAEAMIKDAENAEAVFRKASKTPPQSLKPRTEGGAYAALLQALDVNEKEQKSIKDKLATAKGKDLDILGTALQHAEARGRNISQSLKAFDPEYQASQAEKASRSAERIQKAANRMSSKAWGFGAGAGKDMGSGVNVAVDQANKAAVVAAAVRKSTDQIDTSWLTFISPEIGRSIENSAIEKANAKLNTFMDGQFALLERNRALLQEQDALAKDAKQKNAEKSFAGMLPGFESMAAGLRDTGYGVLNTAEKMADKVRKSMRQHLDFGEELGIMLADKFGNAFGRGTERHFRQIGRNIEGVFENLFENILSGQKNFLQAFLDDFKRMVIRLIAQIAASKVMEMLTRLFGGKAAMDGGAGGTGGAGGGAKGSFSAGLGAAGAGIGFLAGGPAGAAIGGAAGSIFAAAGSMFGFADGGRPPLGRFSLVGERGPELVKFDRGATVFPSGVMPTGVDEMGGGGINIHGPVHIHGVTDIPSLSRALGIHIKRTLPYR